MRHVDTLVVWRLNRLGRTAKGLATLLLSREPRFIALTLLSLAAGSADPARSDEPRISSVDPPSTAAKADVPIRTRLPGGCLWLAAYSTPGENRWRARRLWSMRGT